MKHLSIGFLLLLSLSITAQDKRWQQRANYSMDINMDVETNRFTGKQKLTYTNNSPDTLRRIFYHLYFNAFQPNSSMDVRSRELGKNLVNGRPDWDPRVKDRISKLKPEETIRHNQHRKGPTNRNEKVHLVNEGLKRKA